MNPGMLDLEENKPFIIFKVSCIYIYNFRCKEKLTYLYIH